MKKVISATMSAVLSALLVSALVLALVLIFNPAPSSTRDVREVPIPTQSIKLQSAPTVECYKKNVERGNLFSHPFYALNYRAVPGVRYWWCHNLQGRDWVRPYHIQNTVLYQRKQCVGDRPLKGFRITYYFRDGYRNSQNYTKSLWAGCSDRGFSTTGRYVSKSSTPRLFNVKNIPPYVIVKTVAVYASDRNAVGRKRLPMLWHTTPSNL